MRSTLTCHAEVDGSEEDNISTFIYTEGVDKAGQAGAHYHVLNVTSDQHLSNPCLKYSALSSQKDCFPVIK